MHTGHGITARSFVWVDVAKEYITNTKELSSQTFLRFQCIGQPPRRAFICGGDRVIAGEDEDDRRQRGFNAWKLMLKSISAEMATKGSLVCSWQDWQQSKLGVDSIVLKYCHETLISFRLPPDGAVRESQTEGKHLSSQDIRTSTALVALLVSKLQESIQQCRVGAELLLHAASTTVQSGGGEHKECSPPPKAHHVIPTH